MSHSLHGASILITRPSHQAAALAQLLEQQGANPVIFPTLEIRPVACSENLLQCFKNLKTYQWLIFISANAVNFAVTANNGKIAQFKALKIAAVGKATAKALENAGLPVDVVPETGFNTEALLAAPALTNVQNQKIMIIRGSGGRETLAEVLKQRGAVVDYCEVYQRKMPELDVSPVVTLLEQQRLDWLTVTSTEALRNLITLLELHKQALLQIPLVVISERIKITAQAMGFKKIVVSSSPDDAAILNTMIMSINGEGQ